MQTLGDILTEWEAQESAKRLAESLTPESIQRFKDVSARDAAKIGAVMTAEELAAEEQAVHDADEESEADDD
jgi:hypothetical protein